jgi:hypothetical protein
MEITVDRQIPPCKDYHDTKYCTFGLCCKFKHLHDDMLRSSQLDRKLALDAFKKSQKQANCFTFYRQPTVCSIAGQVLKAPMITLFHHKFCSACAVA